MTGYQVSVEIPFPEKPMSGAPVSRLNRKCLLSPMCMGSTWSVERPSRRKKKKSGGRWIHIPCLSWDIHFLLSSGMGWSSWFPSLRALIDFKGFPQSLPYMWSIVAFLVFLIMWPVPLCLSLVICTSGSVSLKNLKTYPPLLSEGGSFPTGFHLEAGWMPWWS